MCKINYIASQQQISGAVRSNATFYFLFSFASGKSNGEHDCESPASVLTQSISVEIHPDTKARIEEEAYNKG